MSTILEKACKGNSDAIKSLYEANKKEIMLLCDSLLCDDAAVGKAVTFVFKSAWETLTAGQLKSEEELRRFLRRKAVNYCRVWVNKQDSKAFRSPANKNFANVEYHAEKMCIEGENVDVVLKNLPVFHRFVYVLHAFAWFDEAQMAKLMNVSEDLIGMALEAENVNISRIMSAVGRGENSYGVSGLKEDLLAKRESVEIPEAVAKRVDADIETVCRPFAEKARKKTIRVAVIAVAACLIVAVAGVAIGLGVSNAHKKSDADTTNYTDGSSGGGTADNDTTADIDNSSDDIVASYYADIAIKDYGTITLALNAEAAPKTVENFVSLAKSGFYDGLTFHRIMEGFMMQGGDPKGDGTGGSDTNITGEFKENGVENNLSHTRGAISMARSNDYNSASSQFFIVQKDSTFLDGQYAAFGYVTEGMDVVDAVCEAAKPTDDNGTIPADEQPVITSIIIREADAAE